MRQGFVAAIVLVLGAVSAAQELPRFEVASVRANVTDATPTTLFPLGPGTAFVATGGLFRATNQPLVAYVRFAYRLGPSDLLDLPRWVYEERFDIEARVSESATIENDSSTKDRMRLMMRSLLADRFGLVAHTEQAVQSIYELTLIEPDRLGPQLRVHRAETCDGPSLSAFQLPSLPCGTPGFVTSSMGERARITANGETMDRIAEVLKGPATGIDRSIRNQTRLLGTFDFVLEWSRASDLGPTSDLPDDAPPRFMEALQKQLGLRLESARGTVEILVIDSIQRPTEN